MIDMEALRRDGYVRLEGVIGPAMLAEFERVMADLGEAGLARKGRTRRAADAMTDLLKTGGEYRVRLFANLKHLRIVQEMSQAATRRLAAEGFFDAARLTAPLAYPTLRADVPGEGRYLLPMHQDYATQCRVAWRLWCPLRPAGRSGGTMAIRPGSHRLGLVEHDASDPARPAVPEAVCRDFPPLELEMPAGDAVLFDPLLVHASIPAAGDRMKYVLLVQVQDLATIVDPDDPEDPLAARLEMAQRRDRHR
ncbi:hypothetical protein LNKW23_19060 [Paralimibaculum aggregatum]|uniref:Phytanoyl-CoA dioxygenase n=1 Tax=Paralimibaculum aggregatum TaxID=3036245 RepID=A0ABQ6LNA9_9RHOB|nr:phytanoyl-CoA dioxygenase family protein [Limibaculum sp. NKW23]GMG82693.1 hypothetical protein LNKW23_19060 [Limibaculum sp. NKW23]